MQVSGIVGAGKGEGATIGFPTANISFTHPDISGIYAGSASVDGKEYAAAIYADQKRGLLEAHLLDFSGDLYGKEMSIILVDKIREDAAFDTVDALKKQITEDIAAIRAKSRTI